MLLITGIIADLFPSIMGKSIVGCLVIFILGYIVYSDELLIEKIMSRRFKFLTILLFVAIIGILYIFKIRDFMPFYYLWIADSVLKNIVLISAVSTIIGFSSLYLNKSNNLLKYLNTSSFAIYILHQPILLGVAYIIIPLVKSTLLSMILIILISLVLTFLLFELLKNIKLLNIFFGMKK